MNRLLCGEKKVSFVRAFALSFCFSLHLSAADGDPPGQGEWRFDVTSVSSALYNGDNRDTRSGEIETLVNDGSSLLATRLDSRASRQNLSVALRLDGFLFATRPNPTQIGLDMVELRRQEGQVGQGEPKDPQYFRQKVFESGSEMSNRYINWVVPTKYSVAYRTKAVQAIVGDFYAQFGRGFVLSVRKEDALSSDTTIRGGRASFSTSIEKTRVQATLLAGSANPLRVDEASGRYLGVQKSVTKGFQIVTEAGMPRSILTDYAPKTEQCLETKTCSYAPDNIYGARFSVAPDGMEFSTQASYLTRHTILSNDVVRGAEQMITASQTAEFPGLVEFGNLYLEGAGQSRSYDASTSHGGYALYGHLDLFAGIFHLGVEAKHYRAFYPLSAGISTSRAREFDQVQYSTVPTTEAIYNTTQFENFNTCVTGGRSQLDAYLTDAMSVFAWVGRYHSWAESVANEECRIDDDKRNNVWDLATGTELSSSDRRSRTQLSVGVRDDQTDRELVRGTQTTHVFYRESYVRYDTLFHVSGPYSLHFTGWHRYRHQAVGGPLEPWVEGETLSSIEIAPFGNLAFGVEYDLDPRSADVYFNGQLTVRMTSASNISLFVGQRRGSERCVAGVCRVLPPFEGARLDMTLRL